MLAMLTLRKPSGLEGWLTEQKRQVRILTAVQDDSDWRCTVEVDMQNVRRPRWWWPTSKFSQLTTTFEAYTRNGTLWTDLDRKLINEDSRIYGQPTQAELQAAWDRWVITTASGDPPTTPRTPA